MFGINVGFSMPGNHPPRRTTYSRSMPSFWARAWPSTYVRSRSYPIGPVFLDFSNPRSVTGIIFCVAGAIACIAARSLRAAYSTANHGRSSIYGVAGIIMMVAGAILSVK